MRKITMLTTMVVLLTISLAPVQMVSASSGSDFPRIEEPPKVSTWSTYWDFTRPTDLLRTYTPNFISASSQALTPVGSGLSVLDAAHNLWRLEQIGSGSIPYTEAPFLTRHLSWAIDKLYPAGYHSTFETTFKPFDFTIGDYSGTTSLKGFFQEAITRTSTAPGWIGRFGYDPLTDTITKSVHQQMNIQTYNTPVMSNFNTPLGSTSYRMSSYGFP